MTTNELYDYDQRQADLLKARNQLANAEARLKADPYDQDAESQANFLAHVLPTLEKSVSSHPEHAKRVAQETAQETAKAAAVDAALQLRGLDANVTDTLKAAVQAAAAAGNYVLAHQLDELIKGGK